ncbi:MAG TPA: leucyl aminopeptidase family protein [Bacteroidales bacterium]|nr:leucyl aminopeptidase family protein [Bacteroidales bacterium]
MIPEIKIISKVTPEQSVVCILGSNSIPDYLALSKSEKEYAKKCLAANDDFVFINSYFRCTYIVPLKRDLADFRVKEELRKTASKMKKLIRSNNHSELVITSGSSPEGSVEAFAEGLILSIYSFDKYKTADDDEARNRYPSKILLHCRMKQSEADWLKNSCEAVYLTRDLINEPPNHLNTIALAQEIKKMGKDAGFSVEILTKGKIEALKMGGLLAVNRGSVDPPVFCILEWKPSGKVNTKPLVLVGKGVIYDTGGLNIKTGEFMAQMKVDMAGAATVAGIMYTISKCRLPYHVIGLIPATDNRPGGNAYTQGDILTMYNKTTVEVCNTDAEGRLILADAISYSSKYSPELIIDIATLTGSAAMTFGIQAIAVMGNAARKYFEALEEAGNEVYERVAELPFWDEYRELLKSDIADIKNVGGREAGAIIAGKFLESFAEHPYIHLDIAGTGMLKKDDFYRIKEGPGSGMRLLSAFIRKLSTENRKKKN